MSLKIKASEFKSENLVKTTADKKESKGKIDPNKPGEIPVSQTYFSMPILYRYDVKKSDGSMGQQVAPLLVELPEIYSPAGIYMGKTPDGSKDTYSILAQFNLNNEEVFKLVDPGQKNEPETGGFFTKLFYAIIAIAFNGGVQQVPVFGEVESVDLMPGMFKPLIKWDKDPNTKKPIPGKNPSQYLKLMAKGKEGSVLSRRTIFNLPMKDSSDNFIALPWDKLVGVEMWFEPLLSFESVWFGGRQASIIYNVQSAIINDFNKIGTVSGQADNLEKKMLDVDKNSALRNKLAALDEAFFRSKMGNIDPKAIENKKVSTDHVDHDKTVTTVFEKMTVTESLPEATAFVAPTFSPPGIGASPFATPTSFSIPPFGMPGMPAPGSN